MDKEDSETMMTTIVAGVCAALVAAAVVYALMRGAVAAAKAEARATDRSVEGLRAEFASLAAATLEGSRPLLAEAQALVVPGFPGNAKRQVSGVDRNRAQMLLAVLEKRANLRTYNQDVYINVAGGLELSEPAADLALCVAVASSLKDKPVGPEVAVMGEVGLAGEVRTVPQCERRISECARLGFTTIIIPRANAKRANTPAGVKVIGIDTVAQALSVIF